MYPCVERCRCVVQVCINENNHNFTIDMSKNVQKSSEKWISDSIERNRGSTPQQSFYKLFMKLFDTLCPTQITHSCTGKEVAWFIERNEDVCSGIGKCRRNSKIKLGPSKQGIEQSKSISRKIEWSRSQHGWRRFFDRSSHVFCPRTPRARVEQSPYPQRSTSLHGRSVSQAEYQ